MDAICALEGGGMYPEHHATTYSAETNHATTAVSLMAKT